jgi:hypothetical protein
VDKRIDYSGVESGGGIGDCVGYGHQHGWIVIKDTFANHNGVTTHVVKELLCQWCLQIIRVKEDNNGQTS